MVCYLSLFVRLRVSHRSEILGNAITLTKLNEFRAQKLMLIISDQHPWKTELVDDKFSDEVDHFGFSDLSKGLSFLHFMK